MKHLHPSRCLSFNIHGWRDGSGALSENDIVAALVAEQPDVVLLNEVRSGPCCVEVC